MKIFAVVFLVLSWLCISVYLMLAPIQAEAASEVVDNNDSTFTVGCTGDNPELVIAECKATFLQVCPQGGMIHKIQGSTLEERPLYLVAVISCKPDPTI